RQRLVAPALKLDGVLTDDHSMLSAAPVAQRKCDQIVRSLRVCRRAGDWVDPERFMASNANGPRAVAVRDPSWRATIFPQSSTAEGLSRCFASNLEKRTLEETEASENPAPIEILLPANPSDSMARVSLTLVHPLPSLGTSLDCPQKRGTVPR